MANPIEQGRPQESLCMEIIRDPRRFSVLRNKYFNIESGLQNVLTGQTDHAFSEMNPQDINQTRGLISRLFGDGENFAEGGRCIQQAVYYPFAIDHGFTQEDPDWGTIAIPVESLGIGQQAEWRTYLNSVPFIENKRQLVAKGIREILFPVVPVKYRPQNILLAAELERAKREIVLGLLPKITDDEAKTALGQGYTADIVREEVSAEWFARFL